MIYPFKYSINVLILMFIFNYNKPYSQSVTNYEAKTSSFRFINSNGKWKNWSKPINVHLK